MFQPRISSVLVAVVTVALVCWAQRIEGTSDVTIAGDISVTVNSAISVGGGLAPSSDSTTYSVSNTSGVKKLIGRLNAAMPANTTLRVALAAPSGATSAGVVTLTAVDQNLVTGIGVVNEAGLDMTFTLEASVQAGLVSSSSRTLTLTLVDAP